jgi:hypothetical protein
MYIHRISQFGFSIKRIEDSSKMYCIFPNETIEINSIYLCQLQKNQI